jgi:hypothetical protein
MKTYITGCWFQKSLFALAVIGLLSCGNARANITIQDGSPLVSVDAVASTVSTPFTVTAGADVLVVCLADRNQSLTAATNGASPSSLSWGAQTISRVVSQNNYVSHYADSDIYVLYNPTPGSNTITATDTTAQTPSIMTMQVFSLNGVNTSIPPATYGVGNADIDAVGFLNMPVTNVAGAWAAVCATAGDNGAGLSITSSSGTTNWVVTQVQQSQVLGVVQDLTPGSNSLTVVDPTPNGTQVGFAAALFTPLSYAFTPAPTNVVATGQTGSIKLTWDDATGGAATSYNVLRSTTSSGGYGRIAVTTGNSATNYTDTSVVNYVTYYYEVEEVAASTSANSAPPASAYAVGVEPAPVGLAVSSLNGAAGLVWYPSFGATGYQVLRATSNPGSQASYSVIATPTMGVYTNTGLANGTTYYYEVAAVNGFGTGTPSAYVSSTPAVPNAGIAVHDGGLNSTQYVAGSSTINLNVEVTPGANALVAALYDNNGGDTDNASPQFMVWSNYSTGTTQILTRAVSENSAGYNYTDADLYYLWNPGAGAGVVSATDTNSAVPTAMLMQVYSLSGVDTTNFNGGVPFAAGSDNDSASTLAVTTPANTPNGSWAPVISFNYNGGGGNFITNTASSGTPIDFNFQKDGNQNNLGYIANLIAGSSTITASASGGPTLMALAVEVLAPGAGGTPAPTNVVATGQQNQVTLKWDDASGGAATSYTVYRSTNSGTGFTSMVTNNGNASTNYLDTAVSDWTTYYYVVKAGSPNGISLFSTPVASAIPTGTPGTATALTATNGINSVLLTWNDLGATNFNVLRAANTPTGFTVVANVNGNAYTNPGTEATLYYYEVQPINFFGTGTVSSAVSAIPCVAFFTNWISIPVDNTCTNGWVWNTPGVSDSLLFVGTPAPPAPSLGYMDLQVFLGTNSGAQSGGMVSNLPNLNLSTYLGIQFDIANIGSEWDEFSQVQSVDVFLTCPGTTNGPMAYKFMNLTGPNSDIEGDIALFEASDSEINLHFNIPMSQLALNPNGPAFYNAVPTNCTALQLEVYDGNLATLTPNTDVEFDIGFANIEFYGAPGYTPVYTCPAPTAAPDAPSVTLTGSVGSPVGGVPFYLNRGTPVNVTVAGGTTQSTTVYDSKGDFSIVYTLPALGNGSYQITYTTPSDNVSFVAGMNNTNNLTVTSVGPAPTPVIPAPKLNATGTSLLVTPGGNTASGHTYYLLQTTNLNPPVVWTTNTSFAGTGAPVTNSVLINSAKDLYLKYQVN